MPTTSRLVCFAEGVEREELLPSYAVSVSKFVALALGGVCVYLKKQHLIRWATYWYSGLVVWNLMIVLVTAGPRG